MSEDTTQSKGNRIALDRETKLMLLRWLREGAIDKGELRGLREQADYTIEEVYEFLAREFHNDMADILYRRVSSVWALLTDYYFIDDLAQRMQVFYDVSRNYNAPRWELTPEVWELIKPSSQYVPADPPRPYEDELKRVYGQQEQRVRDLWEKLRNI